jgi:DNA recombination protein RmuC
MHEVVFTFGAQPVTAAELLLALSGAACLLLIALAVGFVRAGKRRAIEAQEQAYRAEEMETRVNELLRAQAELTGRVQAFAEGMGGRQAEFSRAMTERLDAVSHRLGEGMQKTARETLESLGQLQERLAVVDAAQGRLQELSSQLVTLKDVLANKQARGAFGQGRMEAIVSDGLPKNAYAFQFTLTNKTRPDCVIFLPGDDRPLVIDAKFPLESITAFREAKTDDTRRVAAQRLRQDITKHVSDIAERYFIAGETQDMALMFVPSESVYAELHENFDDLIQKAFRARVMLVSPSLLMLAVQVIRAIARDAQMREQAALVQTEVGKLMDDVRRLAERANKLQNHFNHVSEDVHNVTISADKILKQGKKIELLELDAPEAKEAQQPLKLKLGAAE